MESQVGPRSAESQLREELRAQQAVCKKLMREREEFLQAIDEAAERIRWEWSSRKTSALLLPKADLYLTSWGVCVCGHTCNAICNQFLLSMYTSMYRNSLLFRCKNIFIQRKHTKIFYANIILQRKLFRVGWLLATPSMATHKYFPNRCCPYILVASNTTSHLLFTSHLFCKRCDFLN